MNLLREMHRLQHVQHTLVVQGTLTELLGEFKWVRVLLFSEFLCAYARKGVPTSMGIQFGSTVGVK